MIELRNKEEKYILSTVRIETESSTGTGFICSLTNNKFNKLKDIYFLVTNKHVIQDAKKMTLKMHKIEGGFEKTGSSSAKIPLQHQEEVTIEDDLNELFCFHPNEHIDVAVLNLNINVFNKLIPLFIPIEVDGIIPEDNSPDINLYDDVTFIGYPRGLYDEVNLLPIIRKGAFATSYQTNFNGEPIFLIDASVFPGSSGSPVFLFDRIGVELGGEKMPLVKPRIYFLGIISAVYTRNELYDIIKVNDVKAYGKQMIDIGVVYKAKEIRKLMKFYFIKEILSPVLNLEITDKFMENESLMDQVIIEVVGSR